MIKIFSFADRKSVPEVGLEEILLPKASHSASDLLLNSSSQKEYFYVSKSPEKFLEINTGPNENFESFRNTLYLVIHQTFLSSNFVQKVNFYYQLRHDSPFAEIFGLCYSGNLYENLTPYITGFGPQFSYKIYQDFLTYQICAEDAKISDKTNFLSWYETMTKLFSFSSQNGMILFCHL